MFILIGVALFAALGYSVAKGFRSDTSSTLTKKQIDLAADDILTYAQKVSRTVDRLRRNGCSESEISFENPVVSGYAFTTRDKCKVFDTAGGGLTFKRAKVSTTPQLFKFNGNNRFSGFGCDTQTAECAELVITLRLNDNPEICLEINDKMGITNPSDDAPQLREWQDGSIFTGSFTGPVPETVGGSNATNEAPEVNGKQAGCVFEFNGGQDNYIFYHILIAR